MELKVLENLKKENVEIYLEYLNSCKSSNWETRKNNRNRGFIPTYIKKNKYKFNK